MAEDNENQEDLTIATDLVVTKYKMGAEIVNKLLKDIEAQCVVDASVKSLCENGDKALAEETAKLFKKEKDMKKGIAFPTCLSVNSCICHFSPLKSDPDVILKDGDMVKIDLGCHIDGFISVAAHTVVVGASKDNKVTGRKADVMMAAHIAAEAALRLVKPGQHNDSVTDAIGKIAETYDCIPIEGMLSHQLKQHVIDGEKSIIQNPTEGGGLKKHRSTGTFEERELDTNKDKARSGKTHERCEFEMHEVYAIDVLISTGEGKGREVGSRTTVFKKREGIYNLKMKTSRQFISDVEKKNGIMPFTLRSFEDETKARMGVKECVKHDLVEPYPVLWEKNNEFVSQFKFTVLLMPNGPMKITGLPFDPELYNSEHIIEDEEIKTLLAQTASSKKAKKNKKKAEKIAQEEASNVINYTDAVESEQ